MLELWLLSSCICFVLLIYTWKRDTGKVNVANFLTFMMLSILPISIIVVVFVAYDIFAPKEYINSLLDKRIW